MEENEAICIRCGHIWQVRLSDPKTGQKCKDCQMGKSMVVKYGNTKCLPWQGEFADDFITPIHNGEPVLPGTRTCKHKDCCNPEHIKKS